MEQFSKDFFTAFRADLDRALQGIADKYQLETKLGNLRYDPHAKNFNIKIDCVAAGGISKEGQMLNVIASSIGLPERCAGKRITIQGRKATLVGANTTGSKLLIKHDENGKTYLYKVEAAPFIKFEEE